MPVSVNSSINTAQRMLEIIQQESELARQVAEGDRQALRLVANPFSRQNLMRTQLIATMWRRIGRQVLAIHPEIVDEVRVASSDKVPTEILRVLPYMNPLVVFSEPVEFAPWAAEHERCSFYKEDRMRLLGFFTAGTCKVDALGTQGFALGQEQRIFPTTSTEADTFTMVLVFEILDAMGKVVDTELNTMSLKFDVTDTLAGLVETSLMGYHWFKSPELNNSPNAAAKEAEARRHRKWMREVLSVLVGSLFYLCSTTVEAESVSPKYVSKRIPKRVVRTPLSFYKIGWTTGAALTRYRQARTNSTSEQADLSHQQDPQHRRAHFKMQPYGPGKAMRKLIFVSAYWTHLERLGEQGVNTARRVIRPNGKGSARESLDSVLNMGVIPAEIP